MTVGLELGLEGEGGCEDTSETETGWHKSSFLGGMCTLVWLEGLA